MRYHALATDYDGTLALRGHVDEPTVAALERFRATGRRLILVTGRELEELVGIFPRLDLFEWVVGENGALLYNPASRDVKLLGPPPPAAFLRLLETRNVKPYSVGHVIVATWHPHENTVLQIIRELGLELQVIFNKDAVMVLPASINKATGLLAALKEMHLSPHNVAGIGDAENDHAFLSLCECSAAVANALPAVKQTADLVTRGDHGAGVCELIDQIVANDLQTLEHRCTRHRLVLGTRSNGSEVCLAPSRLRILVAGPSGADRSAVTEKALEDLARQRYQLCVLDAQGEHAMPEHAVGLGDPRRPPTVDEVLHLVQKPGENAVINLAGVPVRNRAAFFEALLPPLAQQRARCGYPHWLVLFEAEQFLPANWQPTAAKLQDGLQQMMLVTSHADRIAAAVLRTVDAVVAVGPDPAEIFRSFATAVNSEVPSLTGPGPEAGEVALWLRRAGEPPFLVRLAPAPHPGGHTVETISRRSESESAARETPEPVAVP